MVMGPTPPGTGVMADALAATGDDGDASRVARTQWNLEWALQRLSAQTPPEAPASEPEPREQSDNRPQRPNPQAPEESSTPAPEKPIPFEPNPGRPSPRSRPVPASGAELGSGERESWLSRIQDDPRRALLSATLEPHEEGRRRRQGGPTW